MTHDPSRWKDQLQYAAISDIGMRRTSNQDSYAVELPSDDETWRRRGLLFLVADGMGAHAAGELASQLAADSVPHLYFKHRDLSAPESLKRAVIETNAEINRKGQANLDFYKMGTTCSVLTLLPQGAIAAHVGDSRVYRLRQGTFEQLTFDHSRLWQLRAAGLSQPGTEADNAIPRNEITRSLGPFPDVEVDVEGPFPVQRGDTFLLCSDGLVGEVADEEIGALLATLEPEEAVRALVDLANLRGGPDNITVIVCRVVGDELVTGRTAAEPITIGTRPAKPSAGSPILWAVVIAALLLTGLMALLQTWPAVIAFGAVTLISFLAAMIRQFGGDIGGTIVGEGRRFGRGPYTRTPAEPNRSFVDKLAAMIDELRMADEENSLKLDFSAVDRWQSEAQAAVKAGDFRRALAGQLRTMSRLMEQLRERRGDRG
ncbi:MAG TPA: protein phosphatase 2C domain-containing protein [Pirellulaceae bacterium]|nr:protein phosphatase 2C domain-containing protein [Pirellulaceae bacterium]